MCKRYILVCRFKFLLHNFFSPFFFVAVIGFEQGVYPISEMDASVNVCVDVRNGFVDYDLEVNIDILPTSTATGLVLHPFYVTCTRKSNNVRNNIL